jgi:hypothetical protein
MDILARLESAVVGGTGVAFGERAMPAAETVEVVVSVVEVGDTDGFTVVDPLILLAFDIARGFATLSEERVDVDRENRVRAEASEGGAGMVAGQQQGVSGCVLVVVTNDGERWNDNPEVRSHTR